MFGWRNAQDYWFPDIRSLGGAIFVMSAVLYPYVYITARASFLAQSVCVLEVSRTLGRSAAATFWEVALPLARPALAAGVALALMETLNDIGAVEFFGVRTLTVAIYDTWLDRNSLAGAAQIACIMLAFVFALLVIERAMRAQRRFHHTTGRYRHLPEDTLEGACRGARLACLRAARPVRVPAAGAVARSRRARPCRGGAGAGVLAGRAQLSAARRGRRSLAVDFAVVLGYARRQTRSKLIHALSAIPAISYAVPGTVLAIGLLIPLAGLDNGVDAVMRSLFGMPTGLLLSGSAFAIVLAYTIRFLAASLGAVEAGLSKISRNTDAAARTLGASVSETLWRVHLPLLRPALGAAALLVFVDSMKELPATLLLRPFNFDTLATQVFTLASLYRYEEAGLSALTIVVASLAPVLFLHGMIVAGRPGASASSRENGLKPSRRGRPGPLDKSIKSRRRARYLGPIGLKGAGFWAADRRAAPASIWRRRQNGWVGRHEASPTTMEMASVRPPCGSAPWHCAHSLADRRHRPASPIASPPSSRPGPEGRPSSPDPSGSASSPTSRSAASSSSPTARAFPWCDRSSPEKRRSRSTSSICCAAASPSMRCGC